jgi:hypothetical protein
MTSSDKPQSPFAWMADFSDRKPVRMLSPSEIEQMLGSHRLDLDTEYHEGHRVGPDINVSSSASVLETQQENPLQTLDGVGALSGCA